MLDNIRVFCNRCSRKTRHESMRQYSEVTDENKSILWQIIRCAGCEGISVLEEYKITDEEGLNASEQHVYPPRQLRKWKFFVDAPANLDHLYRETVDAFNSNSYLFCAAGLRALVEGICADQGINDGPKRNHDTGVYVTNKHGQLVREKTLDCKIEGLNEKNILGARQASILHEHRFLGNKALHELEPPDQEDLGVAIDLIEHIMNDLYSLTSQANNLRKKRQKTS